MKLSCVWFAVPLGTALLISEGCGVAGPPIPPENVGVAPTIEKQQKQQAQQAGQPPSVIDGAPSEEPQSLEPRGQDEELPSLRPIGTR